MPAVLTVESVSKKFKIQRNRPTTLKESLIQRIKGNRNEESVIWALRDVNFSVEEGRALGIIGHNGAGKSTLLRLLCGLGRPTSGHIRRMGHVSGLLELGTGFHPDMTGRENIMTAGILNGLTKAETKTHEEEIIAFAELEEFIDQPVRTYSSGMYLRLAFAAAIHFDPDVLVIDEVLAVGDSRFQQKCIERLKEFRKADKTLIVTSHDSDQIKTLCDDVLVLERGNVVMRGEPESAIRFYKELMSQRTEKRAAQFFGEQAVKLGRMVEEHGRLGTQEATINDVRVCDAKGRVADHFHSRDSLTIEIEYGISKPLPDLALTIGIFTETDVKCYETYIVSFTATFGALAGRGRIGCHLPELPLLPGRYYINVGLYPVDWSYTYDYHWQMHSLNVMNGNGAPWESSGVVSLRPVWSVLNSSEMNR